MDPGTVVIAALGAALGVWLLSTFLFRVAGTWERVLSAQEQEDGARAERVVLAQLGPFVTGRRDVSGGHQEFSGLMIGRTVKLTRRDHGERALAAMGFPDAVAKKLDGEILARMRFTLVDGAFLDGTFEPLKVEFTHQPPRITGTHFLPPQRRRYRRVQPIEDRVPALVDEQVEARTS